MQREHIKMCIVDDLSSKGHNVQSEDEIVDTVANMLLYYPDDLQLFSKSGCKRVSQKVDLALDDEL